MLPAAVTTGIAWGLTRGIIDAKYELEYVVTSHDPAKWSFSENTDLSEVLLIARKRTDASAKVGNCTFINLWRNPSSAPQALAIAQLALSGSPPNISLAVEENDDGSTSLVIDDGVAPLQLAGVKWGEMLSVSRAVLGQRNWIGGAFAQTDLTRCLLAVINGKLRLPGSNAVHDIIICSFGELARFGPDRRDIADGFTTTTVATPYPAFWGHDADRVKSLAGEPNRWLSPRVTAAAGRPLRDATVLWGRAGRLMFTERMRLSTQRLSAVRMEQPSLSNVWWPATLHKNDVQSEKALVLWLNSTLGLLISVGLRVPTEGPWVQFKKPTLEGMPVLDVRTLDEKALKTLAVAFDEISNKQLQPLPNMAIDETRAAIDDALRLALNLPDLGALRTLLAREPVICNTALGVAVPVEEPKDQFELPWGL